MFIVGQKVKAIQSCTCGSCDIVLGGVFIVERVIGSSLTIAGINCPKAWFVPFSEEAPLNLPDWF